MKQILHRQNPVSSIKGSIFAFLGQKRNQELVSGLKNVQPIALGLLPSFVVAQVPQAHPHAFLESPSFSVSFCSYGSHSHPFYFSFNTIIEKDLR